MLFNILEVLTLIVYSVAILYLFVYSLSQLHLSYAYLKGKKNAKPAEFSNNEIPFVTIQLPLYNESAMAKRLLQSVAQIQYPRELLEIQVLDDSDDETTEILKEEIKKLQPELDIKLIRRAERVGYKAGALKHGLKCAKGELIAIFDADFLPENDFLIKTVGYFCNPKLGVVQTKWGHLNRNYSLLTKMQAFGLDGHFTVEQKGRNLENCFISFNGTAGIWRKECIENAGGWQSDTLTEDLDLSFRAQLKGWKFLYLEDIVSPAELPISVSAYKSQQYRWNKGAAETHIKLWSRVWQSDIPLKIKSHAIIQLFKGFGFIASFILTLVTVPILYFKTHGDSTTFTMQILSFTLICVLALIMFYFTATVYSTKYRKNGLKQFAFQFPSFMALSMGTTLHNTIAVVEGYLKIKTPFVRTPKFNLTESQKADNQSFSDNITWLTYIEGSLFLYFLFAIVMSFSINDYTFLPFHLLLSAGYGYFFFYSFAQKFKLVK